MLPPTWLAAVGLSVIFGAAEHSEIGYNRR